MLSQKNVDGQVDVSVCYDCQMFTECKSKRLQTVNNRRTISFCASYHRLRCGSHLYCAADVFVSSATLVLRAFLSCNEKTSSTSLCCVAHEPLFTMPQVCTGTRDQNFRETALASPNRKRPQMILFFHFVWLKCKWQIKAWSQRLDNVKWVAKLMFTSKTRCIQCAGAWKTSRDLSPGLLDLSLRWSCCVAHEPLFTMSQVCTGTALILSSRSMNTFHAPCSKAWSV